MYSLEKIHMVFNQFHRQTIVSNIIDTLKSTMHLVDLINYTTEYRRLWLTYSIPTFFAGLTCFMSCLPLHQHAGHNNVMRFADINIWQCLKSFYSSFEPAVHCLAAQDLRADVELPSNCLIIQNCRTICSRVTFMVWTFGGQHGQWSVPLHHTQKSQKGSYTFCVSRSGNIQHWCGGCWARLMLFLAGPFYKDGWWCR